MGIVGYILGKVTFEMGSLVSLTNRRDAAAVKGVSNDFFKNYLKTIAYVKF
jgi:hypothetical protein